MAEETVHKTEKKRALALEGHVQESRYFFFDTRPQSKAELAIVFGGHEKCATDFEIKRNTYPYYVIEIPISGRCFLGVDGREYTLEKGTIGGFMPGMEHHYKSEQADPMEHIFVVFTGRRAGELFRISGLDKTNVMPLSKPGEMVYLAEMILKKGLQKNEWTQQLCASYLQALLLEQSADQAVSETASTLSRKAYLRCRRYIDDNFSTCISPGHVAQACDVNVRYMARLFKNFGKVTPHDYIMRLKLNKAASLLLMSNMKVSDIAIQVGFEDPYHFSRNFKKFHGMSPQHYRNRHLEKDG